MLLSCFPTSRLQRRIWESREEEAETVPDELMSTDTTPSWWPYMSEKEGCEQEGCVCVKSACTFVMKYLHLCLCVYVYSFVCLCVILRYCNGNGMEVENEGKIWRFTSKECCKMSFSSSTHFQTLTVSSTLPVTMTSFPVASFFFQAQLQIPSSCACSCLKIAWYMTAARQPSKV